MNGLLMDIATIILFAMKRFSKLIFAPSGDFYLAFEIASFNPVPGIDPNAYELERKGQQRYIPYFTTIDKVR